MSGQIKSPFLIESLSALLSKDVDETSCVRAGRHLVDWLGCAFAGRAEPAGEIIRNVDFPGVSGLAFRWGALGNILEMDDVDKRAILHPGPSIIPAVLALCSDDPDLVPRLHEAIVVGYEATIRLGRATGSGHYSKWHTTGTCGAIGAAAACSRLLGLDGPKTAHALALAMSQTAGLWQTRHEPQSMGKQLHTSHAARAGLDSARLAAAGFKGPLSILEGEQGFFAAYAPDADAGDILAAYGDNWLIHQVSFKPWPACRHAHATIDAALEIHAGGFEPERVETIKVTTYSDAIKFCDKPNPTSTIEAKFSLQHSVGVVLLKGRPELSDFDREALGNPNFIELRKKVIVETGEPYVSAYPAQYGAQVEVFYRDGVVIGADAPDALGDPENPLTPDQIEAKAFTLMEHAGIVTEDAVRLVRLAAFPTPELISSVLELL